MSDPLIQRAIEILRDASCVALPLSELADRVGTVDHDGLARRVAADPRLLLVEPPLFPDLAPLPPEREAAYERALRSAGVRGARRVALLRRGPAPTGDLAALLLETAALLLTPGPAADALTHAADRAYEAVTATVAGAGARPSTTRPPDPPG